jgi:hypothetical protein
MTARASITRPIPLFLLVDSDRHDGVAEPRRVGRFALRVLDAHRSHQWVDRLARRQAAPGRRRPLWRCAGELYEQDDITGEITRDSGVLWPGAAPVGCATSAAEPVALGSSTTLVFATRFASFWEMRVVRTPPVDRLWSLPRLLGNAPFRSGARWVALARRLEARWNGS